MIAYFCELFCSPENPLSIGGVYTIARDWSLPEEFELNGAVGNFEMHLDSTISRVGTYRPEYRIAIDADRIFHYWTDLYLSQSPDFDLVAWEAAKRLNTSVGGIWASV